ncbi:FolC bifunctional protein [Delitschia confertaspora ATCC 74209]|uniref:Folylpolyglutamate synthase n=1 Tax=Delitschia confertaspora ATCC 74209 TaxID=1513339 RepID=A0A9P4MTG4_9PLEO|nr:FolC bifunctional protein [Delitschia confertaspora ATCC 74209]
MAQRDYAAAVAALNTCQSNFSIVDAIRKSGKGMNKQAIPEMIEWCRKVGYEPSEFDKLKPIHIAGTKGKGSTSAFVSSILAQYLPSANQSVSPIHKIGLYTSPHLRFVRERIQINNEPISEDKFTKYFFEVWDRLEAAAAAEEEAGQTDAPTKPVYFRYLTLMALHAYLHEGVDTAVIECGIGGEYDSTNIITHPTVTAVTSLGIDHVAMLGSTLPEIAWHKAGIFKKGIPAFSAPQKEEAATVLRERAAEKGTSIHFIGVHPSLASDEVKLGLSAGFQKVNASVAIAVAAAHLRALGVASIPDPTATPHIPLPAEFVRGLESVKWPGRCEVRREKNVAWHIDGGHTLDSIEVAGRWFAEQMMQASSSSEEARRKPRVLIFNQQTRDASALARALYNALQTGMSSSSSPFTHAIFTTNQTFSAGYKPDLVSINTNQQEVDTLAVQKALAQTWSEIDTKAEVSVMKTIEEAVAKSREVAKTWAAESGDENAEIMVLVTGSLHLVGGAIDVLESGN